MTIWDLLSFVWKNRQRHFETFYLLSESTDKDILRPFFLLSESTDKDKLRPLIFWQAETFFSFEGKYRQNCLKVQKMTIWDLLSFVWKNRQRHFETFYLLSESTDKDILRPFFLLSESTDKDKLRPLIFWQAETFFSFEGKYRQNWIETFYLLSESTNKDMLRPFIFCMKVQTKRSWDL